MSDLKPHPVADLFPMLPADELQELADDIAERGLLQPIVLDEDGRILDGRNRYQACQVHGIAPEFVTYDGPDPDGYALAVNLARRHLSKGQRAIIAAEAWSVSDQNQRSVATTSQVSKTRITEASVVLHHAPDLAEKVKTGALGLDAAYSEARQRKEDADSDQARMEWLQAEHPELAHQVVEESISLAEAVRLGRERDQEHQEQVLRSAAAIHEFACAHRAAKAAVGWKHWDEVVPHIDERDLRVVKEVLL